MIIDSSEAHTPKAIVVPVDGTDISLRALPVAAAFARRLGAEVVVVTTPMALNAPPEEAVPRWLDVAIATCEYPAMRSVMSSQDDPVDALAPLLGERTAVCMTTHARSALGTAVLGSVAQRVVRELDVPVLLLGPHCAEAPPLEGPILVCHDGSPAADAVLAPARAWADALDLDTVLLHVFHPLDVESATHLDSRVADAAEFLHPGRKPREIRSSTPANAITEAAEGAHASLIAMSTHGRTALARVAVGSVTTAVVRHAHCPSLVVRPRDLHPNPDDSGPTNPG